MQCLTLPHQYDLLAPNIALSKDTIAELTYPINSGLTLRLAPDNKIYWSCFFIDTVGGPYPYADSVYNMYNMNLCTINNADSGSTACVFQPYSFYLGGKRTYWGLPNNPDYDLPRDSGSVCDTVWSSLTPSPSPRGAGSLTATYISSWQKLFVNAHNLKGKNCVLKIFDVNGRVVFSILHPSTSSGGSSSGYYTQDVDVTSLANGFYLISLVTEKEKLNAKFVKEQNPVII